MKKHTFQSHIPIVLTIAGSDSGGGAGIQADIKAISATGGYACSVITATTAQNTQGVSDIFAIPVAHIKAQLDAVFSDLNIVAVKIGMLASADIIELVAQTLRHYAPKYLVLDPVMVATSGDVLLPSSAIEALKKTLIPMADLITPNLPESAVLAGVDIPQNGQEMAQMFDKLSALNAKAILVKGGHEQDSTHSDDRLITSSGMQCFSLPRINTQNTHGTGCSLSSAIACYLAQGEDMHTAVKKAKHYIHQGISHADKLNVGQGHGPIHHFYHQY